MRETERKGMQKKSTNWRNDIKKRNCSRLKKLKNKKKERDIERKEMRKKEKVRE